MSVKRIRIKRGVQANLPTLATGEMGLAIDQGRIYIGGASGNIEFAKMSDISGGVGPTGPAGPAGATGEQGPKGDPGSGGGSAPGVYNVMSYGATGLGVVDDTAAINSAIAAVPAAGGKVVIPDGTYLITVGNPYSGLPSDGSIRVKSNIHIEMGKNAIMKVAPNNLQNHAIFNLKGNITNATISGGICQGDRATHTDSVTPVTDSQQGMGFWLEGCSNIRLINVSTRDMWGDGIYTKYHSTFGNCKNIYIENFYSYNDRRQGISICAVDGMTIVNPIIENTNGIPGASSGIDIEPELSGDAIAVSISNGVFRNCRNGMSIQGRVGSPGTSGWATISNCVFEGNAQYGLRIAEPGMYFNVSNCIAKGNTLDGFYMNYATDNILSNCTAQGNLGAGIHLVHADRNTIVNSRCIGNTAEGITSSQSSRCIIRGNECDLNGSDGFDIESSSYNVIDGNQSFGNTRDGIRLYQQKLGKVSDNHIAQNGQNGIKVNDCTDMTFAGNDTMENSQTTTATYDNMYFTASSSGLTTNCSVINNMSRKGALAKLPRYGFRIDTANVTNIMWKHNDFRGGGNTADTSDLGTGSVTT